jgi:hypothetical protein
MAVQFHKLSLEEVAGGADQFDVGGGDEYFGNVGVVIHRVSLVGIVGRRGFFVERVIERTLTLCSAEMRKAELAQNPLHLRTEKARRPTKSLSVDIVGIGFDFFFEILSKRTNQSVQALFDFVETLFDLFHVFFNKFKNVADVF